MDRWSRTHFCSLYFHVTQRATVSRNVLDVLVLVVGMKYQASHAVPTRTSTMPETALVPTAASDFPRHLDLGSPFQALSDSLLPRSLRKENAVFEEFDPVRKEIARISLDVAVDRWVREAMQPIAFERCRVAPEPIVAAALRGEDVESAGKFEVIVVESLPKVLIPPKLSDSRGALARLDNILAGRGVLVFFSSYDLDQEQYQKTASYAALWEAMQNNHSAYREAEIRQAPRSWSDPGSSWMPAWEFRTHIAHAGDGSEITAHLLMKNEREIRLRTGRETLGDSPEAQAQAVVAFLESPGFLEQFTDSQQPRAQRVATRILRELAELYGGSRETQTSYEALAREEGVQRRAIQYFVARYIPEPFSSLVTAARLEGAYSQREKLVASVREEVEAFAAGRRSTLTRNQQLREQFSDGGDRVVPYLASGLSPWMLEYREAQLKRQDEPPRNDIVNFVKNQLAVRRSRGGAVSSNRELAQLFEVGHRVVAAILREHLSSEELRERKSALSNRRDPERDVAAAIAKVRLVDSVRLELAARVNAEQGPVRTIDELGREYKLHPRLVRQLLSKVLSREEYTQHSLLRANQHRERIRDSVQRSHDRRKAVPHAPGQRKSAERTRLD